jgi:aminopeptidase
MADSRIDALARVIVEYSLPVHDGDFVVIRANSLAEPLVQALYTACLNRGAHPELLYSPPDIDKLVFEHGSDAQLQHIPVLELVAVERADAHVIIDSPASSGMSSGVAPEKLAQRRTGLRSLAETFDRRELAGELRWMLALFPTPALSEDAGLTLREYEDLFYAACMLDQNDPIAAWREQGSRQAALLSRLGGSSQVRLVAPGTELTFSVRGRAWLSADGRTNMPDGEIYIAPNEESAEGCVRFTYPASEAGTVVDDVRLWFSAGKVVRATASRNEEFLHAMLDLDPGARRLGEFAFGMNGGITRHTGNVLFDEKIGGTVHLALGSSAGGSHGQNESALHWDMVTDLRGGGEVWVDDVLIQRNGQFVD